MSMPRLDVSDDRTRHRRALLGSAFFHACFVAALLLQEPAPAAEVLTEITMLDMPPATAPPPPPPTPLQVAPEPEKPTPVTATKPTPEAPEAFARETHEAPVAPRPQSVEKIRDDVRSRLLSSAVPTSSARTSLQSSASSVPTRTSSAPAGISSPTASQSSVSLSRGAPVTGDRPISLSRGTQPGAPSTAMAQIERSVTPDTGGGMNLAATADSTNVLRLAGAELMGPVADRALLEHPSPTYPEWAKREAVEGAVNLYFVVLSDGRVKSNVLVQKTSGYPDFDENAIAALRSWRFQSLPTGASGDQWGTVTFEYRLAGLD